jgi:hypothetical protein
MRSNRPLMGRLAASIVDVFPAAWKARYGDELRVLIEERAVTFGDVADVICTAFGEQIRTWTGASLLKGLLGVVIAAAAGIASMRAALVAAHVVGLVAGVVWEGLSHVPAGTMSRWMGSVEMEILRQPIWWESVVIGYSLLFGVPFVFLTLASGLANAKPVLARFIGATAVAGFGFWTGNWTWIIGGATTGWLLTSLWIRVAARHRVDPALPFGARA